MIKRLLPKKMGADHVFLYGSDWVESIKVVTGGKGVDVGGPNLDG
jgi:NADPH2:quinone reductase